MLITAKKVSFLTEICYTKKLISLISVALFQKKIQFIHTINVETFVERDRSGSGYLHVLSFYILDEEWSSEAKTNLTL